MRTSQFILDRALRRMKTRTTMSGRAATHGFTLIELLIGVAIMGLIVGAAYSCLRAGIVGQELVESRIDAIQNARTAIGLMSADMRGACPLSPDVEFVGIDRMIGAMEADNLDFGTLSYTPERIGEGDFCETSYFVNPSSTGDGFSLWRRRDPTPDQEPFSGGYREEIAPGIGGPKLEFYDGLFWHDTWGDPDGTAELSSSALLADNLVGLPDAIRVTLWIHPEDGRSDKVSTPETPDGNKASPLVFQTIVHLPTAGRRWPGGEMSTESADAGDNETERIDAAPGR